MMIHARPEMMQGRREMIPTHQVAQTQFVEANGVRFAYRRFGKAGGVPLILNQHFTGTMDHWDPAVTDGLATEREVILFNNAGISSTSGEVPTSVEEMAANAAAFIKALGLEGGRPRFLAWRPRRAGDSACGTEARPPPDTAGYWTARWRGHG